MRIFFSKLCLFVILLITTWFIMVYASKLINNNIYEKLYSGHKTFIVGDSHVQYLNEKIIPNSLNLYRGGQSYKESFYKLKYFNELNNFDNVILACSFHNFSNLAEYKINEDYYSIQSISTLASIGELFSSTKSIDNLSKVLFQLPLSAHLQLLFNYNFGEDKRTKSEIDNDIKYKVFNNIKEKKFNKKKCKAFAKKRINRHFFYDQKENTLSPASIQYFNDIIEYCEKNNIKLFLVNMPLHPCYRNKIPNFFKIQFKKILAENESPIIEYIDYSKLFDGQENNFRDADHCSEMGGAIISKKLKERM